MVEQCLPGPYEGHPSNFGDGGGTVAQRVDVVAANAGDSGQGALVHYEQTVRDRMAGLGRMLW